MRDRAILLGGAGTLTLLAWAYLWHDAGSGHCARMMTTGIDPWSGRELSLLFAMWTVMMAAMMTPSVAPVLLTAQRVYQVRKSSGAVWIFLGGYLLAWTAFSLLATLLQAMLHDRALLAPSMESASTWLGAAILIAAGLFQWTDLKRRCLAQCSSPLTFLMTHWEEGRAGSLRMGVRHGVFCVGCCWALMLVLFVAGVMNLAWVALLSVLVLVEKLAARWAWTPRLTGAALIVWGVALPLLPRS